MQNPKQSINPLKPELKKELKINYAELSQEEQSEWTIKLREAALRGDKDAVKMYLKAGVIPGQLAFEKFVNWKDPEFFIAGLKLLNSENLFQYFDPMSFEPLFDTILYGLNRWSAEVRKSIVEMFVSKGASVPDMLLAAAFGAPEEMQRLSVSQEVKGVSDEDNRTLEAEYFKAAAANGNLSVVNAMLEKNPDIMIPRGLEFAGVCGQFEMLDRLLLLLPQAERDFNMRAGGPAVALLHGRYDRVISVLKTDKAVSQYRFEEKTLLHVAVMSGSVEAVKWVLSRAPGLLTVGDSPLILAAQDGERWDVMTYLVREHGMDPSVLVEKGFLNEQFMSEKDKRYIHLVSLFEAHWTEKLTKRYTDVISTALNEIQASEKGSHVLLPIFSDIIASYCSPHFGEKEKPTDESVDVFNFVKEKGPSFFPEAKVQKDNVKPELQPEVFRGLTPRVDS